VKERYFLSTHRKESVAVRVWYQNPLVLQVKHGGHKVPAVFYTPDVLSVVVSEIEFTYSAFFLQKQYTLSVFFSLAQKALTRSCRMTFSHSSRHGLF
jgi:hypothetical protein